MASANRSERSEVARSLDLSIIRYSRVWEDYRVLSEALQIDENDDIISITRCVCVYAVYSFFMLHSVFTLAQVIMCSVCCWKGPRASVSLEFNTEGLKQYSNIISILDEYHWLPFIDKNVYKHVHYTYTLPNC